MILFPEKLKKAAGIPQPAARFLNQTADCYGRSMYIPVRMGIFKT